MPIGTLEIPPALQNYFNQLSTDDCEPKLFHRLETDRGAIELHQQWSEEEVSRIVGGDLNGEASARTPDGGILIVGTDTEKVPESKRTTVKMDNIPFSFTNSDMLDLLHKFGYLECVDFVHVPMKCRPAQRGNLGFALINFTNALDAAVFMTSFHGYAEWGGRKTRSNEACKVAWSEPRQGFAAHFDKFWKRNGAQIGEAHRPVILIKGTPICINIEDCSSRILRSS